MEEFKDTLCFACTPDFWRMAVLWTLSLLLSYFQLLTKTLFSRKPISYPRCSPSLPPSTTKPRLPVCIITGVILQLTFAMLFPSDVLENFRVGFWVNFLISVPVDDGFHFSDLGFSIFVVLSRRHLGWVLQLLILFHWKATLLSLVPTFLYFVFPFHVVRLSGGLKICTLRGP